MTPLILEAAKIDKFVLTLLNRQPQEGDHQFWMARGTKLVSALIRAVCNAEIADTTRTDALSYKFLSDLMFSNDDRYRPEDIARVEEEARQIFQWIDEIEAGIVTPIHMSQCDYVMSLYRNELPRFAILRDLIFQTGV
jgi:hypothetical protein